MTLADMHTALIQRIAEPLLTTGEVAEVMGVTQIAVLKWIYCGKLCALRYALDGPQDTYRIRESALLEAVERGDVSCRPSTE